MQCAEMSRATKESAEEWRANGADGGARRDAADRWRAKTGKEESLCKQENECSSYCWRLVDLSKIY